MASSIPSGFATELGHEDTKALIYSILTDDQKAKFEEEHELDFSIGIPGVSRFRVNVFMQRGCVSGVFRTIGENIPTCEDLGLTRDHSPVGAIAARADSRHRSHGDGQVHDSGGHDELDQPEPGHPHHHHRGSD